MAASTAMSPSKPPIDMTKQVVILNSVVENLNKKRTFTRLFTSLLRNSIKNYTKSLMIDRHV
jgi:hypothetical protein